MAEIIDGYCKETMTENEAKDVLRIIGWNRAEEGDVEGVQAIDIAMNVIEEIQQYRAIGTIEEFKALKEKAEPKKIIKFEGGHKCPVCNGWVGYRYNHCDYCGQKLDWNK